MYLHVTLGNNNAELNDSSQPEVYVMTEFVCPICKGRWLGSYTCEHRCTQCGNPIKAREPWREEDETEEAVMSDRIEQDEGPIPAASDVGMAIAESRS